ncbi:hypothetical protein D3C76_1193360 [compost metagenome]
MQQSAHEGALAFLLTGFPALEHPVEAHVPAHRDARHQNRQQGRLGHAGPERQLQRRRHAGHGNDLVENGLDDLACLALHVQLRIEKAYQITRCVLRGKV